MIEKVIKFLKFKKKKTAINAINKVDERFMLIGALKGGPDHK
jgi:hypothetical protein